MLNKRVVVKGNADDDLYGKEGIVVATNTLFMGNRVWVSTNYV